jgi:hypothetical protein
MKFVVYTRPTNIGGGWKKWRSFEADSNAHACDLAFPEAQVKPSAGLSAGRGTRENWLHVSCSEIMAELEEFEVACKCGHKFTYVSNTSGECVCPKCNKLFFIKTPA